MTISTSTVNVPSIRKRKRQLFERESCKRPREFYLHAKKDTEHSQYQDHIQSPLVQTQTHMHR